MFTNAEIRQASATARSSGAVGGRALVPRYVLGTHPDKDSYILDYGSGPRAIHTKAFQEKGYLSTFAYDFSVSREEMDKDQRLWAFSSSITPESTYGIWEIIMVSNVLNVQDSFNMLYQTLTEINRLVASGGKVVFNYPASPRKLKVDMAWMLAHINMYFRNVKTESYGSGKIIIAEKPVTLKGGLL